MGSAVTAEEINFNQLSSNGKIKIKYAFLSGEDLKKRFSDKIAVTENEISNEMTKNKSELKDPKTDRARIKQRLIDAKFAGSKKELVEKLYALAEKKASFNESSALLNGTVKTTREFAPGTPIVEDSKESQPVTQIENSKVFREQFLSLENGISSAPIEAVNGIYIITPELKDIKAETLKDEEKINLAKKLEYQKINALSQNLLASLMEKAKIIKTKNLDKN
jgi:chromosome condensin MukBEF complex kleisin-like MukF subunit